MSHIPNNPVFDQLQRRDIGYWAERLYRNCFTRNGRQFRLRRWSVKIQRNGVRRAVTLHSENKEEAAEEALFLYETIQQNGWERALAEHRLKAGLKKSAAASESSMGNLKYWKSRLLKRRYIDLARGHATNEYSVRIEHGGTYHYFLLGEVDEEKAAAKAAAIQEMVIEHGWEMPRKRFEREVTIAIYWTHNPLACTYTTLITEITQKPRELPPLRPEATEVWLISSEEEVSRRLETTIDNQKKFYCGRTFKAPREALDLLQRQRPGLILIHRDAPEAFAMIDRIKSAAAHLPVYPYGCYEDRDRIFMSFVGIKAGYILQRREPAALFSPLQSIPRKPQLTAGVAQRHIRHYFERIFQEAENEEDVTHLSALTTREQEIITYLTRGLLDKELAEILDVSYWTIHNHLKKIYQKLGVHNRTEAVVKYLGGLER
jgi:DNA-binding NarL/FixJ family response regulator